MLWILSLGTVLVALIIAQFSLDLSLSDLSSSPLSTVPSQVHYPRSSTYSYDRVVVMLVDALRADFVLNRTEMEYTRSLYQHGLAKAYTTLAHAPTVTMPRIKAIVTGGVPSFLDAVRNLNAKALQGDHLIARMGGLNVTLYGDETWVSLFPGSFNR